MPHNCSASSNDGPTLLATCSESARGGSHMSSVGTTVDLWPKARHRRSDPLRRVRARRGRLHAARSHHPR